MPRQSYLVSTTMGGSLIDRDNYVYVQVNNREFVRKRPHDLRQGEMVLFEKPYATTTIDDVEPFLERSPRYAHAVDAVHERNSRGDRVPKLRTLLIRGLAERGIVQDENLEARIMGEAEDFSRQEYRVMLENVKETLLNGDVYVPVDNTIDYWLKGFTRAPGDWNSFRALETINPEFRDFQPDEDNPNSMYFNYRLWRVVRQGVMRYLNNCRGTTVGGPPQEEQSRSKISLSPEYDIVFSHFIKDHSIDRASARITDIRQLDSGRAIEHVRETEHNLSDGVVNSREHGVDVPLKDWVGVWDQFSLLQDTIETFIEKYELLSINGLKGTFREASSRMKRAHVGQQAIKEFYEYFGEALDEDLELASDGGPVVDEGLPSTTDPSQMRIFKEAATRVMTDILRNITDDYYGFSRGSSIKLLESLVQSRKTMPRVFFRYKVSRLRHHMLKSLPKKAYIKGISKKLKIAKQATEVSGGELRLHYGLDFKSLTGPWQDSPAGCHFSLLDLYRTLYWHQEFNFVSKIGRDINKFMRNRKTPLESLLTLRNDRQKGQDFVIGAIESLSKYQNNVSLWSREEARQVLADNGVEQVLPLIEENFIWEEFV